MRISAGFLFVACAAAASGGGSAAAAAETKTASDPSLESQARQVAGEFLRDNYCQCEDSFYRAITVGRAVVIDQFKATKSLVVVAEPVTPDDRKDGIEWKGTVVLFEFSATRQYRRSRWGEWEAPPLMRFISERLTRKNGQWKVGNGTDWFPGVGFADQRSARGTLTVNCAQIAFLSDVEDTQIAGISPRGPVPFTDDEVVP